MKIAVVVVTFNRLSLLRECIFQVYMQSIPFSKVCVVNNCSSDGTESFLETLSYPNLIVYNCKSNQGGSWGFYKGLKLLNDVEYDYVLLIDDDAILNSDFLEKMYNGICNYPGYCAYSSVVKLNDMSIDVGHRMFVKQSVFSKFMSCDISLYNKKVFECDTASFCGLLVSKFLVSKIGYPEKNYFIWYDDVEYSLRIRKVSKILNVNDAVIIHKTRDSFSNNRICWKTYYGTRNYIDLIFKHFGIISVIFVIIKYLIKIVVYFGLNKKIDDVYVFRLFIDSMLDGIKGRLGRNSKYLPK